MSFLTRRQFSKTAAATAAAFSLKSVAFPAITSAASTMADTDKIAGLSLTEAIRLLRAGSVTSTQLTQACLERIRIYNPKVNAYITVLGESALAQAAQMDTEQKS